MYEKIIGIGFSILLGAFLFWRASKYANSGTRGGESGIGKGNGKFDDELRESDGHIQERLAEVERADTELQERLAEMESAKRELKADLQRVRDAIERSKEARAKAKEWLDNNGRN